MNFDLIHQSPFTANKNLELMSKTDASKWSELFRDWSEMSLLDDIELNTDYYAFSLALWNKLTM